MHDCEAGRPDRIDISNNPSVFDALDGSDGVEWDLEKIAISIPANVGVTTVQGVSAPNNLNPDSLNWVVAALRVAQLDIAAPSCPTTSRHRPAGTGDRPPSATPARGLPSSW